MIKNYSLTITGRVKMQSAGYEKITPSCVSDKGLITKTWHRNNLIQKWPMDLNRHFYMGIYVLATFCCCSRTPSRVSLRIALVHSLELEAELALGSQFLPLKPPACLYGQKNLYISNQLEMKFQTH